MTTSSNDGLRQASARAAAGTALTYDGDWHALFDQAGIAPGPFNGRMLAWCNAQLGANFTEINGAMTAFAVSQGSPDWDQMGAFTIGGVVSSDLLLETGSYLLLQDGATHLAL